MSITFTTHKAEGQVAALNNARVHVFIKNRPADSSRSEQNSDFVSNLLSYNEAETTGPYDINPYLGRALGLVVLPLPPPSQTPYTRTFPISLRSQPVQTQEVILPVVNVHLYAPEYVQWAFSYTVTLVFDEGTFTVTSDQGGVDSILIDSDNPDHSGLGVENPFNPIPLHRNPAPLPIYLETVTLDFGTHNDGKDKSTRFNVRVVNRLSATSNEDIAVGLDLFDGEAFPTPSTPASKPFTKLLDFPGDRTIVFGKGGTLPLASNFIPLQNIVLPVVYIIVVPTGGDRWIFDYRITFTFSNGEVFSSRLNNVSLDAGSPKHMGVYNGPSFSAFPLRAPAQLPRTTFSEPPRAISLSAIQNKLEEAINKRQPPLFQIQLNNSGNYGSGTVESYYDFQTVEAAPPPPGTLSGPGFEEGVKYSSSPTSLRFLAHDVSFQGVNSTSIQLSLTQFRKITTSISDKLPVAARIDFKTPFQSDDDTVKEMWIEIGLTLTPDKQNGIVDVLSWITDINNIAWERQGTPSGTAWKYTGRFLGADISGITGVPADVIDDLVGKCLVVRFTEGTFDLGGAVQKKMRQKVYESLATPGVITHKSMADHVNDYVNGWLLAGIVRGSDDSRRSILKDLTIDGDSLLLWYSAPVYDMPKPSPWPGNIDFSPGRLSNIEHIVVLTKENRSFDSMLGYLSLPVENGGQGRTDVDGLKGHESNTWNGKAWPSFAFEPGDTIFSPNSPQDYNRVMRAVNNGAMDGFVQSYFDQNGAGVAPRVMGYHNAANVPVFDALVRDFGICHRWFASHPGPTFCNRYYELSGRLNISADGGWALDNSSPVAELDYSSPLFSSLAPTIFDSLSDANVTWKYFENTYCFLRFFRHYTFGHDNIAPLNDPERGFFALAKAGQLPSVSFIDPHYIDYPPGANDDEPPADVKDGQKLVQSIVEAVVASPNWEKTLLIITYDEHGGFFDHVPPPKAPKVTPESVETYGLRVPTFFISPWVKGGSVFGHDGIEVGPGGGNTGAATETVASSGSASGPKPAGAQGQPGSAAATPGPGNILKPLYFDHTSILKTIARRFLSNVPNGPPYLGPRYAAANDLSMVIGSELRAGPFRPFLPYNFVYAESSLSLGVKQGSLVAGAGVWQDKANPGATAQEFRLEDAGDGYWYIRTHAGNLYLTADPSFTVTQQLKYPVGTGVPGAKDPNTQRWKIAQGVSPLQIAQFSISNAAFPTKLLQPAGNGRSAGAMVVLGDPETVTGVLRQKNPWSINSPRLGTGGVVAHA